MTKTERISKTLKFLERNGYALHATSPRRGIDLIVFKPSDPDTAIFVAVMPLKSRSFPMQPFRSRAGEARFNSLATGACKWIEEVGWKGNVRFDSVLIHDANGLIDHIANAGRKELR